jgi:GAF domain-containing protein
MNDTEREQLHALGALIANASEQIKSYERAMVIIRVAIWQRGKSAPKWALDALADAEKEILK